MRTKRITQVTAVVFATGLASLGLSSSASAQTGSTAVPLPIAQYAHMLVDPVHQHLFISGGAGSTSVLVTDYAGRTVGTIEGEDGADGLALSPDGGTVYAALGDADAISAIDTGTLAETARYGTGAGSDPESVVWSAGKLWFGYGKAAHGGIGSVDPAADPAVVTLQATGDSWYSAPLLAATPGGKLVAGQPGLSPASLASYDVSGRSARTLHAQLSLTSPTVSSFLADLAITADGKDVITACGAPYEHQVFTVADLSPDGAYGTDTYPDAVALGADGTVFAGSENYYGDQVFVFAPGNPSAVASYPVALDTFQADAGLAVTPDDSTLFAISADPYGADPVLHVIQNPAQAAAGLTVSGPARVHRHAKVTLTGALGGPSPYTGGQTVQVSRIDAAHPAGTPLPAVRTAADGTFTVTDIPRAAGAVTYQVTYAGDAHLTAATASATVRVGH
ncbi:YncE family protein [Streptomyces sp. NPDC004031]